MNNPSMLALGETQILPGIIFGLLTIPAAICTLIASLTGKRNLLLYLIASVITAVGAWGMQSFVRAVIIDGLPEWDVFWGMLYFFILLAAGVVSLVAMSNSSVKGK